MRPSRPLVIAVVASLTTGCAVAPRYAKPEMPLPAQYVGQSAVEQRSAAAPAELSAWWTGFGDPQLTRYVTLALEHNLDLAQASARVAQARAGLGAAQAALKPSGAVSGQAVGAYQSVETPLGQALNAVVPDFDRAADQYELNLGASWELDVFGGLRRGRDAAVADYQGSVAGAVAARLAVAAQTADIYISVRGLQTRLDVTRRQVRTQEDLVSIVAQLHGRGLAAERELRQAEGALAEVRASLPALESGCDSAMYALDVMLGTPPGTHRLELTGGGVIPAAPQVTGTGSPSDLLRRRPDVIVAERRLAAANARIGAAMAEYYPKVSLGGLLGSATAVNAGNLFTSGAFQSAGILGLRWRLFDFARIGAQIDQAKGEEAEMLAAYRLAVLRATEDVENAFSALIENEEQARRWAEGVDSLGRAREAAFTAYQRGVVSLIEVLHADEQLLRAADARARAQAGSARAAVAAFRALGGGWQPATAASAAPAPQR
jgi:NodT family efflux transporter outer membrane factor (OMF) lipoprotein